MKNVGERLREARTAADITQIRLAELLGENGAPTHPLTVTRVEAGKQEMKLSAAVAAAQVLGVSLDWLAGSGEPNATELTTNELMSSIQASITKLKGHLNVE